MHAAAAEVGEHLTSYIIRRACTDSPMWDNGQRPGGPLTCASYAQQFCESGAFTADTSWASGAAFNHPERHCCACGKRQVDVEAAQDQLAKKDQSAAAVLARKRWYEGLTVAGRRNLALDSRNLSAALLWARTHDPEARDSQHLPIQNPSPSPNPICSTSTRTSTSPGLHRRAEWLRRVVTPDGYVRVRELPTARSKRCLTRLHPRRWERRRVHPKRSSLVTTRTAHSRVEGQARDAGRGAGAMSHRVRAKLTVTFPIEHGSIFLHSGCVVVSLVSLLRVSSRPPLLCVRKPCRFGRAREPSRNVVDFPRASTWLSDYTSIFNSHSMAMRNNNKQHQHCERSTTITIYYTPVFKA